MNLEARAARLWTIFAVFFALILFNLFRMQILQGDEFRELSEKNRLRVRVLEAPRGVIKDRSGKIVAGNRLSFNCSFFPQEARKHLESNFQILSPILEQEPSALKLRYLKAKPGQYGTVLLAEDISIQQAMEIEERSDELAGVLVETRPIREYPAGESVGMLTGYTGPQSGSEADLLTDAEGYYPSDWIGKTGLESFYETYLHGKSGGLQMEVNSRGRLVRALGVREPKEGRDVELSIDLGLQKESYRLLGGRRGAVVVVDLRDGGVLAMVSSPSYDPNRFASSSGRKTVGEYFEDEDSPMLNRSVQSAYPLGSVFKIFTALAALRDKKISDHTQFTCEGALVIGGKRFRCWNDKGHGAQDLVAALTHSCDVFFYRTGLAAGSDAIREMAKRYGFGEKSGIDLPSERAGHLPSKDWKRKKSQAAWYEGDTANFAIGQGYLQVTPLQAVLAVGAVGTGEWIRPHLVRRIDGVMVTPNRAVPVDVDRMDLERVRAGLLQAVQSDTGTGKLARIAEAVVAGKTGTAETGVGKPTHAWFAGYAPAGRPIVAVSVFLEYGGHGGVEAASVAHGVFQWLSDHDFFSSGKPQ